MDRLLLPVSGAVLALLAILAPAQGQTQPGGAGATQLPKVRILAAHAPPLADEQLPEGGLVLALVNASLSRAKPGAGPESTVRWTREPFSAQALSDPSVDLSLPVESADCDRPNELTQTSAVLCDQAVFSDPIFQVVLGLFTLTNSTFKFETDQSILGKTICLSRDTDVTALNANGRNWASYKRITVLRRATLLDCVAAVQAHDADAFVATDLESAHLLRRLGLAPYFAMQPRPLATRGLHAVVARGHERAADLISALNQGLKRLKEGDAYAAMIQRHLITAASASTKPQRREPPPTAKAPAPATATALAAPAAAAAKPEAPAKVAVPPAATPPATAPATAPPVLDPASRQTALRYLKRGDEELAEGRVAPARLLYERAADMGLAQAAMALAATYDAAELNKPHLRNILPDPVEAKHWYQRAQTLGAADAGARLQRLGANLGAK